MTYPSDFKPPKSIDDIIQIFESNELPLGYIIEGYKHEYIGKFPNHLISFNANVLSKAHGKIWYGDLDITLAHAKLKRIAEQVGEPLYVLSEHEARFGKEDESIDELLSKAIWDTTQDIIFLNEYKEARNATRSK